MSRTKNRKNVINAESHFFRPTILGKFTLNLKQITKNFLLMVMNSMKKMS